MPYANGDPTLGEQIEEDQRREFYTKDLLADARDMQTEIKELRACLQRLNDRLDEMWNDPARLRNFEFWTRTITGEQQIAKRLLSD